jgi:hypothetical protein
MGPLYGHTTTFLVDTRGTNLALARTLVCHFARSNVPYTVLDIDALYSSGSDLIFGHIAEEEARTARLFVPQPGFALEAEIATLLGSDPERSLIVDSLNSLYHLLSGGGRGSRNMGLAFAVALLSYAARTEKRAVILTMYQREGGARFGNRKSISSLSDITVSASVQGHTLALKCERGSAWPGRGLSVPIP